MKKAPRAKPVKEVIIEVEKPGKSTERKRSGGNSGVGATIGNMLMPGVGGVLGNVAESAFKTIFGKGDYVESENITQPLPHNNTILGIQDRNVTKQVMQMHAAGGVTNIKHREYIGSVSMSATFVAAKYQIFPTTSFVFPWLSGIAHRWQKWKLLGMAFEYVPTSTNAISGGTPAVGQVSMVVNYDDYAPIPTSLQNMLNTQGSVSCRPQDEMVCAVECDAGQTPTNPLFIPDGGAIPDNKWFVFADLVLATQGPVAYSNAGQLWVTYDIDLISAYISPLFPTPNSFGINDGKDDVFAHPAAKILTPDYQCHADDLAEVRGDTGVSVSSGPVVVSARGRTGR